MGDSAKYKVLTAVLLQIQIIWDVMPCLLVNNYGIFKVRSAFLVRVNH